ncbi:DnaD domain protein [Clostridium sp. KNHs214]|uniref:DnaD domain-containing protein n=1 Tax=Clostridium sp. KNHs214 TaxID=1540257 RepID=UPI00069163DF|nr:DnaD domain protein [Clostridium sp. KNHs214]
MAVFRMFYINFWRDAFIVELTPEEKYFYIYTMTNPNTNQCGIYQISKKTMSFETGFAEAEVENLLNKLTECGYIKYCESSKELMITNWIRENFINSPNNIKSLNGELKKVINKDFLQKFYNICTAEGYPLDKLFQGTKLNFLSVQEHSVNNSLNNNSANNTSGNVSKTINAIKSNTATNVPKAINTIKNSTSTNVSNTIDTTNNTSNTVNVSNALTLKSSDSANVKLNKTLQANSFQASNKTNNPAGSLEETTTDRIQEPINVLMQESQANTEGENPLMTLESSSALEKMNPEFKNLINLFSSNIHPITPLEYAKLSDWSKDIEPKAIEIAIFEAVNHNARSMSYINCILNNWISLGIKSKSQVQNYQKEWNEKQSKNKDFKEPYCIPNAAAYDYVDFTESENNNQNENTNQ